MPTLETSPQILCSRTEFDRRIAADPNLRNAIAGFSTFSLTDLMRSRTDRGFSVPLFSRADNGRPYWGFADLHPDVYKEVFNVPPNYYRGYRELMVKNRAVFGKSSAFTDYLVNEMQFNGSANDNKYGLIVDLYEVLMGKKLKNGAVAPNITETEWALIKDVFPKEKDVIATLSILRQRGGVQVIIGPKKEFIDFLKDDRALTIDDCAAEFYRPIPPELVLAVLPLGSYEKKALGV